MLPELNHPLSAHRVLDRLFQDGLHIHISQLVGDFETCFYGEPN